MSEGKVGGLVGKKREIDQERKKKETYIQVILAHSFSFLIIEQNFV